MNVVITVKYILFCFRLEGFLKLSDYKTVSSSNDDPPATACPCAFLHRGGTLRKQDAGAVGAGRRQLS